MATDWVLRVKPVRLSHLGVGRGFGADGAIPKCLLSMSRARACPASVNQTQPRMAVVESPILPSRSHSSTRSLLSTRSRSLRWLSVSPSRAMATPCTLSQTGSWPPREFTESRTRRTDRSGTLVATRATTRPGNIVWKSPSVSSRPSLPALRFTGAMQAANDEDPPRAC